MEHTSGFGRISHITFCPAARRRAGLRLPGHACFGSARLRTLMGGGLLAACMVLGACAQQSASQATPAAQDAAVNAQTTIKQGKTADMENTMTAIDTDQVSAPDEKEVIYHTYLDKVDGSSPYKIQNDSYASFWFGQRYEVDGEQYYTGFTYATAERFGEDAQDHVPAPGDKVTIGQATFKRAGAGAAKPWDFVGSDEAVGETGAFDQADPVKKDGAKVVTHQTADGDYLIAVPTESLQSGSLLSHYEIFVRNAREKSGHYAGEWNYYGQVYVGADNQGACGAEGTEPCAKSVGQMTFVDRQGSLPQIHVQFSGTEIVSPGKTRTLGAEDGRVYVFDTQTKRYIPTPS